MSKCIIHEKSEQVYVKMLIDKSHSGYDNNYFGFVLFRFMFTIFQITHDFSNQNNQCC